VGLTVFASSPPLRLQSIASPHACGLTGGCPHSAGLPACLLCCPVVCWRLCALLGRRGCRPPGSRSLRLLPACRFPCNVLAGFEKDCGATYFDLTYLQVRLWCQVWQPGICLCDPACPLAVPAGPCP
jgi:hypothetical protein